MQANFRYREFRGKGPSRCNQGLRDASAAGAAWVKHKLERGKGEEGAGGGGGRAARTALTRGGAGLRCAGRSSADRTPRAICPAAGPGHRGQGRARPDPTRAGGGRSVLGEARRGGGGGDACGGGWEGGREGGRRRRRAAGAHRPGLIGRAVYKRCLAGVARLFAGAGELGGAVCGAVGAERSCDASRQPRLHQVLARLRGAGQRRRPRERPGAAAAAPARAPAPTARVPLPPRRPRPPGAGAGGLQRRPLPLLPSSGKRGLARALPTVASAAASHPAEEGKALV